VLFVNVFCIIESLSSFINRPHLVSHHWPFQSAPRGGGGHRAPSKPTKGQVLLMLMYYYGFTRTSSRTSRDSVLLLLMYFSCGFSCTSRYVLSSLLSCGAVPTGAACGRAVPTTAACHRKVRLITRVVFVAIADRTRICCLCSLRPRHSVV